MIDYVTFCILTVFHIPMAYWCVSVQRSILVRAASET